MTDFKKLIYNYMESIINFEGTSFADNPCLNIDNADQIVLSKIQVALYADLTYDEYLKIEHMDLITLDNLIKEIT